MTKEEMARQYVDKSFYFTDQLGGKHGLDQHEDYVAIDSFIGGFNAATAQASEGFEAYFKTLPEDTHDWFALKNCYEAARLSAQKETAETFSLTTVIKDGVYHTQPSTDFYFKRIKELEARLKDLEENEELLRTHMNRIGYNKLKELEAQLEQQKTMNPISVDMIATIADLSARLKEAKELLFAYDAMDLHDEGCLGAYAGRELQCNCNLRDVREYKSKYASDINDKNL